MIGFMMVVAPGEGELAADAVRAIVELYPQSRIWIRDDATEDGAYQRLEKLASYNDRIDLVRNPVALGLKGLPVSLFRSFKRICETSNNLEMVVKLDPDVCIVREGLAEFAREKFAQQGPGILGSYALSPSKSIRSHRVHRNSMLRDLMPFGFDRESQKFRPGFPFYLGVLPNAFRHGYRLGHHAIGAFYIMHGETLRALDRIGYWDAIPDIGSRSVKNDDPLVSLGAYAVGHKLIEIHADDRPRVWIQLKSPLPLSAAEVVAGGYMAVHPLKNNEPALLVRAELQNALFAQKRCPQESAVAHQTPSLLRPGSRTYADFRVV